MSVQIELTTNDGVTHPEAYAKLFQGTSYYGEKPVTTLTIKIWHNAESRRNLVNPINIDEFQITGEEYNTYFSEDVLSQEGMTMRKAGYLFMKTKPKYSGGIDL